MDSEPITQKNMGKLYGVDVSHFQGSISWSKVKKDFAIVKCSQGTIFKDPMLEQNKAGARRSGILLGYYHFANGEDPKKEADWFMKCVGDIKEGELLVLDWEIKNADPVGWCKKFLDRVTKKAGFRPLIYLNSSTVGRFDWSPVIKGNYGLWIASYGLNLPVVGFVPPKIGRWPFYAVWQYSSRGKVAGINGYVDLDYCKCSLDTLKKYGK